ncbi:MAG: hypothetical protein WCA48_05315 [Pseudomonas gingeri]|uniref:hypothetical protein n=1 Tax=Pseudomonas sp. FEN TaxID=2767468 RepID=UPI00174B554E|nr:hypothetical protein [Pseudomonas sp. FEN]CAD5202136.1 hypothetical protein [Pseudomonas sp. FEN]
MNRVARVVTVSSMLFVGLLVGACDQNEPPKHPPTGIERGVAGSWAEGIWIHFPNEEALPELHISGDKIAFGQCSFALESLLQGDEKQAYMVLKSSGDCPLNHVPSNIVMTQISNCKASVVMYASLEDISKSVLQQTGQYTKSGCSEASTQ